MLTFRMELRHFRYFIAVAEAENVSRAALKLHISQPGLSRQIRDLEEEIGFQLFQREAHSLRLTEAGKAFLPQARAVLQHADEAVRAARAIAEGPRTEIQAGYAPSLTVYLLPQALRAFQAKFPRVRVVLHDLSSEEMLAGLRSGKLDLALMAQPSPRSLRGLAFRELGRHPLRVALAPKHPLARARSLGLEQIAAEPLIAYNREHYPDYHQALEELFASARAKPRIAEEHDGVTGLIAAIESGAGIALVPSLLSCMVGSRLKLLPLNQPTPKVVIGAASKAGPAKPLVQTFIDLAAAIPPIDLAGRRKARHPSS